MLERRTRIICTIGDLRKDIERKSSVCDAAYREAVKRRLEADIFTFVKAGMNVARINMAHYKIDQEVARYSDKDYLRDLIRTVREVSRKLEKPVAIMGDIQGPKVRIAGLATEKDLQPVIGKKAATSTALLKKEFLDQPIEGIPNECLRVEVSHEGNFDFVRDIKENHICKRKPIEIHIGEKGPVLKVVDFISNGKGILCETIEGGKIKNRDGMSVKNSRIKPGDYDLKYYPKDQIDLEFLLKDNDAASGEDTLLVDVIALSFVRSNVDIHNVQNSIRKILRPDEISKRFGRQYFPIISKIETQEGVDDIRRGGGILEDSYGIMVARGDLGLYCPIKEVAKYQKDIIRMCRRREKPVIVATEMLDRMILQADPSRAESTDVFNAVCDGADALMLSGETATGKYRRASVEMMNAIIKVAEKHLEQERENEYRRVQLQRRIVEAFRYAWRDIRNLWKKDRVKFQEEKGKLDIREDAHHIAYSACELASQLRCSAIIALTRSGGTARLIARYRPETRIIAGVYYQNLANILMLSYGVEPVVVEEDACTVEEQFALFRKIAGQVDLPTEPKWSSRRVVAVSGSPLRTPGITNYLHILHYDRIS